MIGADYRVQGVIHRKLRPDELAYIEILFDTITDEDERILQEAVDQIKEIKRVFWFMFAFFPIFLIASMFLHGFVGTKTFILNQIDTWKMVRKPLKELTRDVYTKHIFIPK